MILNLTWNNEEYISEDGAVWMECNLSSIFACYFCGHEFNSEWAWQTDEADWPREVCISHVRLHC